MRIRIFILSILLLSVAAVAQAAQTGAQARLKWNDSTRDIYINGEIDRAAQMLFNDADRRYAIISARLDRAIVLDLNDATVSTAPKEAFSFAADRASASSESSYGAQPSGKYTLIENSTYLFAVDGKTILIRPHGGLTGEITSERLFQTVPVWHAMMNAYQPDAPTIAMLNAQSEEAQVTVVLGSWCSDSKNYVPKLLKALWSAGNEKLKLRLVGVDSQFHEPIDAIQRRAIVNVPTVIVERKGREIGRITETPAASTMEEDLVAILNGHPNIHTGRWDRGPEIARGAYEYRDRSGKQTGSEDWILYSTAEGGQLIHSKITAQDSTTEVWHRLDAKGKTSFVEVTSRRGDSLSRTRYRFNGQTMTARLRGNDSGVIEQTVSLPEQFAFMSPTVADEGWAQATASQARQPLVIYVTPQEFDQGVGLMSAASYEAKPEEAVTVPAGQFRARRFAKRSAQELSEWWFDVKLGLPVRGQAAGGVEYVLTKLELAKSNQ